MKRHLANFRKGWQSENLARYILSNFAFISQPSTIADDLGSDFFCTMFDIIVDGNNNYLVPKESFAIQIKSNGRPFSISGKIEYLKGLGIPFFVGVCDKKNQELELYSGEYLIPFFVDQPSAEAMKVELCERNDCQEDCYSEKGNEFTLKFPKVGAIGSDPSDPQFNEAVQIVSQVCRTVSRNITRRNNKEYIFIEPFSNKLRFVLNKQFIRQSIDNRLGKICIELAYALECGYIDTDLEKYESMRDALCLF
ncbi:MAG: hypothetical protein NT010_02250 [Proteobacteria bacterium]|nr:hypothetical protein [Pseudomonadota bacterium]